MNEFRSTQPGHAVIDPFIPDGRTAAGLDIAFKSIWDKVFPKVFATVLATNKCDTISPGDTIHFWPHVYEKIQLHDYQDEWFTIAEENVAAVLDGYDRYGILNLKDKKMRLRPLRDFVAVRVAELGGKSHGGIELPDQQEKNPQEGEVLRIGPKVPEFDPDIVPGAMVAFVEYRGSMVTVDGEEIMLMPARCIAGVIESALEGLNLREGSDLADQIMAGNYQPIDASNF